MGEYRDEVEADKADGERYEVTGTPTVYANGRKLQGVPSYEMLSNAIEEALSDQQ
jgi:protein-disulfide isomerase